MNKRLISLKPCPKGYTYDQDKACTPEETVARFQERLRATDLDVLREIRRRFIRTTPVALNDSQRAAHERIDVLAELCRQLGVGHDARRNVAARAGDDRVSRGGGHAWLFMR